MDDAGQANITAQATLNYDIARYCTPHSQSIVPGGFEVMSYVTRLIPRHSLMIRLATRPKNAWSKG